MGGIAHPLGYSLIIGNINLATRVIRMGEPAHIANTVNASFATTAGVALFYIGWLLTRSRLAAVLAAVVVTGFSIWAQAILASHSNVQTMLVFFVVLALVAYDERPDPTRLAALEFATGFSLTNHGLSVFMLPATALVVATRRFPGIDRPRMVLIAGAASLLGLTSWRYVLRGLIVPVPANQPEAIQCRDLPDVWHLIVGRPLDRINESGATAPPFDDGQVAILSVWPAFAHDVLHEFGWFWIAALLGWLVLARTRPRLAGWTAWTSLTNPLVCPGHAAIA